MKLNFARIDDVIKMPVYDGPIYEGFDKWYMHYWIKVREIVFNTSKNRVQLLDADGNHIMTVDRIKIIGPSFKVGGDTLEVRDFCFQSEGCFIEDGYADIRFASDVEVTYEPTKEWAETRLLVHKQGHLSAGYKDINIEE